MHPFVPGEMRQRRREIKEPKGNQEVGLEEKITRSRKKKRMNK